MFRRRLVVIASLILVGACAQPAVPPSSPSAAQATLRVPELRPIAHWVGGRWEGTFEASGRKYTLVRTYEWSFDGRLIVGRSFARVEGKLVQSRETPFYWNPETQRIEFVDFLDDGGYGAGTLGERDGQLTMEVKVIGNPGHPSWRATIREAPDAQVIRVEAQRGDKWFDFGTYPYQRVR